MRHDGPRRAVRTALALIRAGRARMAAVVLIAAVTSFLSALSLMARSAYVHEAAGTGVGAGMGDALPWLFLGDPTGLHVEWLVPWVVVLFAALPSALERHGALYVRTGGRCWAWAARSAAAVVRALAALTLLALLEMLWLLAFGARPEMLPAFVSSPVGGMLSPAATALDVTRFAGALVLGASSLALVQLALGEVMGRAGALLACVVMLAMAAFAPSLPLPFSCLMASRVDGLASLSQGAAGGASTGVEVVRLALLGLVGAVSGAWSFRRRDLVPATRAGAL